MSPAGRPRPSIPPRGRSRGRSRGIAALTCLTALLTGCGASSSASPTPTVGPASPSDTVCPRTPSWNPDSNSLVPVLLPANPTATIPAKHLVPDTDPAYVWLCRYRFDGTKRVATYLGVRQVTNPAVVHASLWAATPMSQGTRHCPEIKLTNTGYLTELVYPDNTTVWLEDPGDNLCFPTTNGTTLTDNHITQLDAAFKTGTWPSS